MNGKCLEKFSSAHNHRLEVKNVEANVKMGLLLSQSADVCILWSTNKNQTAIKERSLFAKNGVNFSFAKFTADGSKVATLFRDGEFLLWSLDA